LSILDSETSDQPRAADTEAPPPAPKKLLPVVLGCHQTSLMQSERHFFANFNPFGFILFKRNCENPEQVQRLIKELRLAVGREDAPIFIDQEGGRVARLQRPHWSEYPPARLFGATYENDPDLATEALKIYSRIVANELARLGILVNCAPVVDLFYKGASPAIGDRAFSRKPAVAAALARLQAETFLENGVLPVIKHFPGHGRLKVDPHKMLPVIEATLAELESDDFVPFELLKDLPMGMNSHAVFMALDPKNPASLSRYVQQEIIRGRLGFDGLLLSDDIAMEALHGTAGDLARRVQAAGAEIILHCNGEMEEMLAVVHGVEPMSDETMKRWGYARSMVKPADPDYRPGEDIAQLDILLGGMAYEEKSVG
jgi:beta-N-acetylhexosaminidase